MSRTHSIKDTGRSCIINTLTYFLKTVYPARFPRKHAHEIQFMYSKRMKIPVLAELRGFHHGIPFWIRVTEWNGYSYLEETPATMLPQQTVVGIP